MKYKYSRRVWLKTVESEKWWNQIELTNQVAKPHQIGAGAQVMVPSQLWQVKHTVSLFEKKCVLHDIA